MATNTSHPGLYQTLLGDLRFMKVKNPGLLALLYYALRRPGFLAVLLYRLSANCVHKGKVGRAFAAIFGRINYFVNACDIHPEAVVGQGFWLTHPVGVVVGKATMGNNVCLLQNTTLGVRKPTDNENDPSNYPTIGNDVTISAGAAVMGKVRVGNGAHIGAKTVVLDDIPDHCTAVGIPARILGKSKESGSNAN